MNGLGLKIFKSLYWLWLAFLLYVVIGASLGFVLQAVGIIGPFCSDTPPETYPACKPCGLYGSVFGVVEIADCNNAALEALLSITIMIPRVIIAGLALLVYPVVEPLAAVSIMLPALILLPLIGLLGAGIIRKHFYKVKNISRGLHRSLLTALLLLTTFLAISW